MSQLFWGYKRQDKNHKSKTSFGVLFYILTLPFNYLYAQENMSFTSGLGVYELANIGVQYKVSERASFEFNGGTNFGLNDKTLWAVGLSFNQFFLQEKKWKIKPGYALEVLYWTQNDDLYLFKTLSFPAMILLAYRITDYVQVRAEGGFIYSTVLASERKQNVTTGYPDRFNANFGVKIIYKLRKQ